MYETLRVVMIIMLHSFAQAVALPYPLLGIRLRVKVMGFRRNHGQDRIDGKIQFGMDFLFDQFLINLTQALKTVGSSCSDPLVIHIFCG